MSVTNTDTITSNVVVIATQTSVVTSTPTTTIPTPAGFTPISLESSYLAKRNAPPGRLAPRRNNAVQKATCDQGSHSRNHYPHIYPQEVDCAEFIESVTTRTITRTDCRPRTKTVHPQTVTVTSTYTAVVTASTQPQDATATATMVVTSTVTATVTKTDTSTATEIGTSMLT